jgi:hypothetical protein
MRGHYGAQEARADLGSAESSPTEPLPARRSLADPVPASARRRPAPGKAPPPLAPPPPPATDADLPEFSVLRGSPAVAASWRIAASRPAQQAAAAAAATGALAAAAPAPPERMGRRRSWLRFLALQAATDACLEALLEGVDGPAAAFLADGAAALKRALGLAPLLLPPAPPGGRAAEVAIYWDDTQEEEENAAAAAAEEPAGRALEASPPRCRLEPPSAARMAALKAAASPERAPRPPPPPPPRRGGPYVEASVLRVVGCAALAAAGGRAPALRVRVRAAGAAASPLSAECAWATLTADGGRAAGAPLPLYPDALLGALEVELSRGGALLAAGTVQVAELHAIATAAADELLDCDGGGGALGDTAAGGLLARTLHALVGRRPEPPRASMAWVRLVGADGAVAAHVVLAARVVAPGVAEPDAGGALSEGALAAGTRFGDSCFGERPAAMHASAPAPAAPDSPAPPPRAAPRRASPAAAAAPGGGALRASARHVYDELHAAALAAAGAGPGALSIKGSPWAWLLAAVARRAGVRRAYCALAHLHWLVRASVAAPTAAWLRELEASAAPLVAARAAGELTELELALLAHVLTRAEEVLAEALENYHSLGRDDGEAEDAEGSGAPAPAAALRAATALLALTRGAEPGEWLASRLRAGARRRFQALLAAAEARRGAPPRPGGAAAAAEADAAFARLEDLVAAVEAEARADERLAAAGALPLAARLPALAAGEHARGTAAHLRRELARFPPPAPRAAAVRLLEAVAALQAFYVRRGYSSAAARLAPSDAFSPFIDRWLEAADAALRRRLRGLEAGGAPSTEWWAGGLRRRAAPLVEGVLAEAEAAAAPFERVVALWPARAAELEAALAGALRAAAAAAARQCGLLNAREPGGGGGARVAWRWAPALGGAPGAAAAFAGAPAALRRGLAPEHALLLNSLRRLLVAAPRLEAQLGRWAAAGAAPAASAAGLAAGAAERLAAAAGLAAPELGAHWAQLARELRTAYSAAMTLCAEALAAALAADPPSALAATLRREAPAAAPAALERRLCRTLDASAPTLRALATALDGRAFVALARGLWDLAARDVLRFAEDPSAGGGGAPGAWRARAGAAAALNALDAFFRAQLAGALGVDLGARDMAPPAHAARGAALFADAAEELGGGGFAVY